MMASRRGLLGAGLALGAGSGLARPRRLLLVSPVLPPFTLAEGDALGEGMDVDYAQAALRAALADYEIELQRVPWRRVLQMLEHGEADFTTSVHITSERERYLAFSESYGYPVRHHVYSRRAEGLRVSRLEDLAAYRVGVVAGYAFAPELSAALGAQVERAKDLATLVRMLAAQRIQLLVGNDLPLAWFIRQFGLQQELEQQPLVYDSGRRTQMGFARARPGHEQLLQAMNRGLRLLNRGDRWKRLEAHYLRA